jgi:hypothetical protein
MPVRSKGRIQTKRVTLVPQHGGLGLGLTTLSCKKIILFRNLRVETGCRGGQGSPRAVAPTGRQA